MQNPQHNYLPLTDIMWPESLFLGSDLNISLEKQQRWKEMCAPAIGLVGLTAHGKRCLSPSLFPIRRKGLWVYAITLELRFSLFTCCMT